MLEDRKWIIDMLLKGNGQLLQNQFLESQLVDTFLEIAIAQHKKLKLLELGWPFIQTVVFLRADKWMLSRDCSTGAAVKSWACAAF